ncbi:Hypothetical protein CINCED_3A018695 [Cinara cedri]|uniref:Reverse transcriptase domain n=1 Tax=Cinara cedri TaxID=506608 RepID=A0A5E4ME86_9HEMI|nr:Hypothetical protein CINCED_3A018695 [Cinara cedri]
MAIVYSTAEYGAPVWINSAHVTRIDSELNNAMRIISGTTRPKNRRHVTTKKPMDKKPINRIRTGQGRCGSLLFKWRYKDSAACDCGEVEQTMKHIVESCPRRSFEQGTEGIHKATKEAIEWLIELIINYYL